MKSLILALGMIGVCGVAMADELEVSLKMERGGQPKDRGKSLWDERKTRTAERRNSRRRRVPPG